MLITLSRRTAICQSFAEVRLTGVAALGAVSHSFNSYIRSVLEQEILPLFQGGEDCTSLLRRTTGITASFACKFARYDAHWTLLVCTCSSCSTRNHSSRFLDSHTYCVEVAPGISKPYLFAC